MAGVGVKDQASGEDTSAVPRERNYRGLVVIKMVSLILDEVGNVEVPSAENAISRTRLSGKKNLMSKREWKGMGLKSLQSGKTATRGESQPHQPSGKGRRGGAQKKLLSRFLKSEQH